MRGPAALHLALHLNIAEGLCRKNLFLSGKIFAGQNNSMITQIKELVESLHSTSNFVVDIGASTGSSGDPAYAYITSPEYRGLCIEGNPASIPALKSKVASSFEIHCGFVTPDNILDIFRQHNVPADFNLLKVDIDGYDLQVIRKILSQYRPKILVAEINEKIPPPILFETNYKTDYKWDSSHCFGFSLSAGQQVMQENDYCVIGLCEMNNIVCAAKNVCLNHGWRSLTDMRDLYQRAYVDNPKRLELFSYNRSVDHWLSIDDPTTLVREVANALELGALRKKKRESACLPSTF
ncbi:MAG: FkbM family methyltransferase [Verrucomicrobia bacterium]|nr:FkbM family methyltransferase [Verrucomicrobiota bacterium]